MGMNNKSKTLGILALVFGIISLLFFWVPVLSVVLAFAGLILGIIGIIKASKYDEEKALVIVGTVVSVISFGVGVIFSLFLLKAVEKFNDFKEDAWFDSEWFDSDFFNNQNDDIFYEDEDQIDTNNIDIDSLLMNSEELKNLETTIDDPNNGPGDAPE